MMSVQQSVSDGEDEEYYLAAAQGYVRSVQLSVNNGGDEEYYLVAAQGYDLVPERGSHDLHIRVLLPS